MGHWLRLNNGALKATLGAELPGIELKKNRLYYPVLPKEQAGYRQVAQSRQSPPWAKRARSLVVSSSPARQSGKNQVEDRRWMVEATGGDPNDGRIPLVGQ